MAWRANGRSHQEFIDQLLTYGVLESEHPDILQAYQVSRIDSTLIDSHDHALILGGGSWFVCDQSAQRSY